MRIGIGLPNQVRDVRPEIIPAFAAASEAAGFSSLGTVGRIAFPGVMDTVALAAAAGATSSIGLFTNVLIGTVWPPVMLAKELAGIDGVSGGRLTLGIGIGARPDDFVVDGLPNTGLGKRIDGDLEVYRSVWNGEPVGGGENAAVPAGTRQVPMIFGGMAPAAFNRMARWGEGYVGGSAPAAMVSGAFDMARKAWSDAGREGAPRLVAIAYYAFGDYDTGKANVRDYYTATPGFVDIAVNAVALGADGVRQAIEDFEAIGAEELIFNTTVPDLDQIGQLADVVF